MRSSQPLATVLSHFTLGKHVHCNSRSLPPAVADLVLVRPMESHLKNHFVCGTFALLAACQTPSAQNQATLPHEPVALIGQSAGPSSQYDVPPKLLSGRTPMYPITQLRQHRSGDALIAFTIDEQGIPRDFRVLKSDYPYFATHAVVAMREWRFQPATKNGRPVAARIRIPFHYRYGGPWPAPAQP
jgi:TonB family protein